MVCLVDRRPLTVVVVVGCLGQEESSPLLRVDDEYQSRERLLL